VRRRSLEAVTMLVALQLVVERRYPQRP
jgi:hypothetical protein